MDRLITNKTELLIFLREHKNELKDKFGIKNIALFGSFARDEQNEDSDVDIVIVDIEKKDYFNRINAKYFLEEQLKKSVDIGYLDSMRSFLRKRIEKEMIYV
ncbi:MAG: nucleotidyltransferase family protein [Campylobacterales bacterium]|nr:nucleotidyltransferase family protein [Campylobacterales bacterium]